MEIDTTRLPPEFDEAVERAKIIDLIQRLQAPGACISMPKKWRQLVIKALELGSVNSTGLGTDC